MYLKAPPIPVLRLKAAQLSALRILWAFLSIMVAATCCFSFLQPFWFFHPDNVHSFGIFNYCVNDPRLQSRQVCLPYGGHFNFSRMPSGAWLAACVLLGGGCVFLTLGASLAFLSIFIADVNDQKPATLGGYFQTVAVLILVAGLMTYPLGLGSPFMRYYCGQSSMFNGGHCRMGWSYMLAIMGTSLAIFCPIIGQFIDAKAVQKQTETTV